MKANQIESLLDRSYREFSVAAKSIDTQFLFSYLIGGKVIRINFANQIVCSVLSPAIEHLRTTKPPEKIDLDIRIYDSKSYPSLTAEIPKEIRALGLRQETEANSRPIFYFGSNNYSLAYQTRDGVSEVNFFDKQNMEAVFWIRDINETLVATSEVITAPFRTIFAWFFSLHDKVILHSAGVGSPEGGILLIGPGGSGKTSSALSSLHSGLKFAGDDSILVSLGVEPHAYSLYSSARLFTSDLRYFDFFNPAIERIDAEAKEKSRLLLAESFSEMLIPSFPIKAIIAPIICEHQEQPLLEVISPAESLRILAPSSLLHIPGQNQATFHSMVSVVNAIPSFRLYLGNRGEIGPKVYELLSKQA